MVSDEMNQPAGRRPVNLGLVIGVVFVLLAAITAWVIIDSIGDGGDDQISTETVASTSTQPASTTTPTTSPLLLPSTAAPSTTASAPTTSVAATTSSTSTTSSSSTTTTSSSTTSTTSTTSTSVPDLADGGDLGVPGHPITVPECTGSYITILGSVIGEDVSPDALALLLNQYPDASYLRTDQTCASLTQNVGGEPVYVVYYGPFADIPTACDVRIDGPADAYVRSLSDTLAPNHTIDCT